MHRQTSKKMAFAFVLNCLFIIIEFIGGIFTNSISIMTHAIHDLADTISIIISYAAERIALRKPNSEYTFGYQRYSLLGALITSLILIIGSCFTISSAIPRLFNPSKVNDLGMILIAIFGIVIYGFTFVKTRSKDNINLECFNLHLGEDVLSWLGILVSSLLIRYFDIPIFDPILSILITLFILFHAFHHIVIIFKIFLETKPEEVDIDELSKLILKKSKVERIHHIHVWTMDGVNNYITLHLVVDKSITQKEIINLKRSVRKILKSFDINHSTIEIDYDFEKIVVERNK